LRDGQIETRAIDMHITRLRQKLVAGADNGPDWIVTVRGKGYMLGPDVQVTSEGDPTESS
jgi:DNA-binding response OmpR family regulator